jgi:hypothetical protein
MHPYVAHEIARQHEDELRRSACRYGQLGHRRQRRRPVRQRTGRVLVEVGLTLVRGSGDV